MRQAKLRVCGCQQMAPGYAGDASSPTFFKLEALYPDAATAFAGPPVPQGAVDGGGDDGGDGGYSDDGFEDTVPPLKASAPANGDDDDGDDDYGDDFDDATVGEKGGEEEAGRERHHPAASVPLEDDYGEDEFEADRADGADGANRADRADGAAGYEDDGFEEEVDDGEPQATAPVAPAAVAAAPGEGPPPPLHEGCAVMARFGRGAEWYPGRVTRVHASGKVDISYDDGDREEGVKPKYVRLVAGTPPPPAAVEEEEVLAEQEEAEPPPRRRTSSKDRRAAADVQQQQPAVAVAPAAQTADECFEAALGCLSALRVAMKQVGLEAHELLAQLGGGGGGSGRSRGGGAAASGALSLAEFRAGARRLFGAELELGPLLGAEGPWAAEGFDPAGDAAMACLDTQGAGLVEAAGLAFFLREGPVLGPLWQRLRAAAEASPKLSCEGLDGQLFARYDRARVGLVGADELRRGLKHLKGLSPPLDGPALAALAAAFACPAEGSGEEPTGRRRRGSLPASGPAVDYLRLVSWLNPVRVDRAAKRASKALRAALAAAGRPSPSKAAPGDVSASLGLGSGQGLALGPEGLLHCLAEADPASGWALAEARALVLRCSGDPGRLVIDAEGLLRVARMHECRGLDGGDTVGGVGVGGGGGGPGAQPTSLAGAPAVGVGADREEYGGPAPEERAGRRAGRPSSAASTRSRPASAASERPRR